MDLVIYDVRGGRFVQANSSEQNVNTRSWLPPFSEPLLLLSPGSQVEHPFLCLFCLINHSFSGSVYIQNVASSTRKNK